MEEEVVLCAASAYEQKFYLNPQFESLPEAVRQELQIMCVLYMMMEPWQKERDTRRSSRRRPSGC